MTPNEVFELYARIEALEEKSKYLETLLMELMKDFKGHFHRTEETKSTNPINKL